MHELSVAMSVVEQVERILADQPTPVRVRSVKLRIGELAGVIPEALQSAFPQAIHGTPLHGARLEIERVPVTIHCPRCAADRPAESVQAIRCAQCGSAGEVVGGRELEIVALEVEDIAATATSNP